MKLKSCMLAIPGEKFADSGFEGLFERIKNSEDFTVHDIRADDEDGSIYIAAECEGEHYLAEMYVMGREIPDMCKQSHYLTEEEREKIDSYEEGICIELEFGENSLKSYHFHIKLLCRAVPDVVGIFDYSGTQLLSGEWARLAASSKIPPSMQYMYGVHAVVDDNDFVWLHTHGLNRCGLPELEIVKSNSEKYRDHSHIIEGLAGRLVSNDELIEEKEDVYLARLANDIPLVVTTVDWEDALEFFEGDEFIGDRKDRCEGHIEFVRSIFIYQSQAECEKGIFAPVTVYDEIIDQNPLYFITNSETDRMKALATERVDFVREAAKKEGNTVLFKLGLVVDEEHRTDTNSKEHIWFELKNFYGDKFEAKLTQEPYYISGLAEGDVGTYTVDEITDWLIFTPEGRIGPDSVYLL